MRADAAIVAESYFALAHKLAWKYARGSSHDVDDLLSDALFGLAKAAARSDGRLVTNLVYPSIEGEILHGMRDRSGIRASRKSERPAVVSLSEPVLTETLAGRGESPFDAAARGELWRQVDRLPDRQRDAIRLHYGCGLSQREIAPILGVSQMHVSRLLTKGCSALRDMNEARHR